MNMLLGFFASERAGERKRLAERGKETVIDLAIDLLRILGCLCIAWPLADHLSPFIVELFSQNGVKCDNNPGGRA